MPHIHEVLDADKHFIIDPCTGELVNYTPEKSSVRQFAHNSERLTFELPRIIEGHDMSTCNIVEVHFINIDAVTGTMNPGLYPVKDLAPAANGDGEETIKCSWLISKEATQLAGPLLFRLNFICSTNGNIDYLWPTAIYRNFSVADGINNTGYIVDAYPDVLVDFNNRLSDLEAGGNVDLSSYVKTVNGVGPDANGNVNTSGSDSGQSTPIATVTQTATGATISITDKNGTTTATVENGKDGADYALTDDDKDEIAETVKKEVPLVKVAEQPDFVDSVDKMTDKTKAYVLLPDGYLWRYGEKKNYNLLKISEVSFQSRLDNASAEIVASNQSNLVTGWFPVTYGKYYARSIYRSDLGDRIGYSPAVVRVQLQLTDGTIKIYTNSSGGNPYPFENLKYNNRDVHIFSVDDENAVSMRIHFGFDSVDASTASLLEAYQPMIVEGNTPEEAASNTIDLAYHAGDEESIVEWYNTGLAYNQPADYEGRVVKLESEVSALQADMADLETNLGNPASLSPYYRDVDYGVTPTVYYQGVGTSYDAEGFGRSTNYATFIAAWKSLVANHSTYVTETELGKASDGQPIYLYNFKPARVANQRKPIPKIIIVAGQHGWEKANVYGLYYFVGNLLNRWTQHPALEYLRNQVELMIVPVVNTYGFDNLTYTNANGVNINRNYSYNWVLLEDATSNQYGGAEPFDQPESQIIRDLILSNTRAALVIDCHSCHHYNPETVEELTYLGVCSSNDSYYNRMLDVAAHHLARMSAHFNVDYYGMNHPDVIMGFLTKSPGNGILRSWVTSNNIVGVLVEGLQGFYEGESFVGDVYKADEEHIVNYLMTALSYLSR